MRVSVTDIDQYLWYKSHDDMALEDLVRRLTVREQTEAMAAGTAFHDLLEHAEPSTIETAESGDFRFVFDMDVELPLTPIRELKGEKQFFGDVTLVSKVDGMDGLTVLDHKLTTRFDPERYTNAFQWRAYLDIFGAHKFVYSVFEASQKKDGSYVVRAHHALPFYGYPGMAADVANTVKEYRNFARKYLEGRE